MLKPFGFAVAFLSVIPEGNLLSLFVPVAPEIDYAPDQKQIPFGNDTKKNKNVSFRPKAAVETLNS